jgi:restriction endonuclease S subunit
LGYEWSAAKGNEGIKLSTDAAGKHHTPLYDEDNPRNPNKINYYIEKAFLAEPIDSIPETLQAYLSTARLVDMLDFTRTDFNKVINSTSNKNPEIKSKWESIKLGDITLKISESINPQDHNGTVNYIGLENIESNTGNLIGNIKTEYKEIKSGKTVFRKKDVLYGKLRPNLNKVYLAKEDGVCSTDILVFRFKNEYLAKFCFQYLSTKDFNNEVIKSVSGVQLPRTSWDSMAQIKIPVPPTDIQQKIVQECEAVDIEYGRAKQAIIHAQQTIEQKIVKYYEQGFTLKKLVDVSIINPSKREIVNIDNDTLVSFVEMASVSDQGFIETKVDRPLHELRKGSYTYFRDRDIIIAKITPCMENGKCAYATQLTNGLGMGSSEFHVIRANENQTLPEYVFAFLNRDTLRKEAERNMTGSSGHRRVPATFYENYKIPVPDLKTQQALVDEITALETAIQASRTVIDSAAAKKAAIVKKYL